MKNTSKTLALTSLILTVLYVVYISYKLSDADEANLSQTQYTSHVLLTAIGLLSNGIGVVFEKRPFLLAAAILYGIAIVTYLPNYMFLVVQIIFLIIAFGAGKPESDGMI